MTKRKHTDLCSVPETAPRMYVRVYSWKSICGDLQLELKESVAKVQYFARLSDSQSDELLRVREEKAALELELELSQNETARLRVLVANLTPLRCVRVTALLGIKIKIYI